MVMSVPLTVISRAPSQVGYTVFILTGSVPLGSSSSWSHLLTSTVLLWTVATLVAVPFLT